MSNARPEWTFTNLIGIDITTYDASTAEKYRHDSNFTEVIAAPVPYARRKKDDLVAEIATRNVGRPDDDLLPSTGTIAQLAAALDADDDAQAATTTDATD